MRLDINLASQPYQDARRFWFQWGGALAIMGVVTVGLLYFTFLGWTGARKDRALMSQYEQQIAARDKEKADAQALMNLPQNASTRDRSQFLNDLFYRKAFSWTRVFEDLEKVMPPRVHVVSIQPELGTNNELAIKLVVAGDSPERVRELVRKMEASKRFQQTEITQETSEVGNSTNPQDTVKFDIGALYLPELEPQTGQGGAP
jgi:type IV pilus assembly protein PilN